MLIAFKDQDGRIHFRQGSLSYPEQITTLDDIKQLAQIPEDLSKQAEAFVHKSVEKSLTDFYSAPDCANDEDTQKNIMAYAKATDIGMKEYCSLA